MKFQSSVSYSITAEDETENRDEFNTVRRVALYTYIGVHRPAA